MRNRWGHWFEYDANFFSGIRTLGDEVLILCDRQAEDCVVTSLKAEPVLPQSIWHRMSDKAGPIRRMLRIPAHGIATFVALRRYFSNHREMHPLSDDARTSGPTSTDELPGLIFVPTVLVHHLLGWYGLLKFGNCPRNATILLFFPNLPLQLDETGQARWNGSPSTRLMAWLFQQIRPWVEQKKVVLGTETEAMQQSLAQLIGMPVIYLPHPIEPLASNDAPRQLAENESPLFACYGTARAEKGSDFLQSAIERIVFPSEMSESDPFPPLRFAIQWLADFTDSDGNSIHISQSLSQSGRVEYIQRFFVENEYEERLRQTDAMILPYLASSYNVRVSRIVIEAMVHGIPVIASEGTTVWSQVREFGAGVSVNEGDPVAIANAMRHLAANLEDYAKQAHATKERARFHFSIQTFRRLFLDYIAADCLVLGDSNVVRWNWAALGTNVWSYGVSGVTSAGLLELLFRSRMDPPPSLILWIGTNDITQGVPPSEVLENLHRILAFFPEAHANKRVGIVELPPVGGSTPAAVATNRKILELNEKLETLARELELKWICYADQVTTPGGELQEDFTSDGSHLNRLGYEKISERFRLRCTWLRTVGRSETRTVTPRDHPIPNPPRILAGDLPQVCAKAAL